MDEHMHDNWVNSLWNLKSYLQKLKECKLLLLQLFSFRQRNSFPLSGWSSPVTLQGFWLDAESRLWRQWWKRGSAFAKGQWPCAWQLSRKKKQCFLSLSGLGWGRESRKSLSLMNRCSAQKTDIGQGCTAVEFCPGDCLGRLRPGQQQRGLLRLSSGERQWLGRCLGIGQKEPNLALTSSMWNRREECRAQPLKEYPSHKTWQELVRINWVQDGGRFDFQWTLLLFSH